MFIREMHSGLHGLVQLFRSFLTHSEICKVGDLMLNLKLSIDSNRDCRMKTIVKQPEVQSLAWLNGSGDKAVESLPPGVK